MTCLLKVVKMCVRNDKQEIEIKKREEIIRARQQVVALEARRRAIENARLALQRAREQQRLEQIRIRNLLDQLRR